MSITDELNPDQLPRIEILEECWCDKEIKPFNKTSTHEVIIRRYVGGHGHIVDVAMHPACYQNWLTMGGILDAMDQVKRVNG